MSIPIDLRRPREPFPSITVPALLTREQLRYLGRIGTHLQGQMRWEGAWDQGTRGEDPRKHTRSSKSSAPQM